MRYGSRTQWEAGVATGMDERGGENPVRRGWLRWLGVGGAILALAFVALWTQRTPIAENFISRELNRRGIQATYALTQVGFRTQRIENILLGDPAHPDLTAKWVEVDLALAGITPQVVAIRAGGVRMRASYRDGTLRLGELDKFRDPDSTAPFSLPDIVLGLQDARLRLDSDAGAVGLRIDGSGNARSGFRGKMAVVMPAVAMAGCRIADASALIDLAMKDSRPHLTGAVRAVAAACQTAATAIARPVADVDIWLGKGLDRWTGSVGLTGSGLRSGGVVLAQPVGRIDLDGTRAGSAGRVRLRARALSAAALMSQHADVAGSWQFGGGEARFQGRLSGRQLRLPGGDPLSSLRSATAATPIGPLAARFADAVRRASADNMIQSQVAIVQRGGTGSLVLTGARFSARSGATLALDQGGQAVLTWPGTGGAPIGWALNGAITSEGGGLPHVALRLARRAGGGLGGQLFMDPYAAADARLALDPVRFFAGVGGATRFTTALYLDGPLPGGGIRGLRMPLDGVIAANGGISVNTRCVPIAVREARYGTFALRNVQQAVCPLSGDALFAAGPGGVRGGADLRKVVLAGSSGDSPMRLTADSARFALGQAGFSLSNLDVAIGPADAPVRLTATGVSGAATESGFGGLLSGAGGRIGSVPLIVENARGRWGFAGDTLKVSAGLTVRDAEPSARFQPLNVPDFTLALRDGRIAAGGTLRAQRNGAPVATVDIGHDLGTGRGRADLLVSKLVFDGSLQPEDVTLLARGVVANVVATVSGEGHIAWNQAGVTSTGVFRTDNAKLAAAFGPVEGLTGELRFTDLLGLVSAPGQEMRVRLVNPGVEVRDGIVRYRLEPNQRVHIEGGEWPFSGGRLVLLPTTMDFGADVDRYMTFRVIGLDAGAFIQAMDLKNISATGTFDGIMPLVFNARGGRVAGGVLVARQQGMAPLIMPEGVLPTIPCDPVRQSGTLSYVGPVSNEQLGAMGRLAFDALKNLQYKCLTILMDGALDGEMVTNVVFNGVNRGQIGKAPAGFARSFVGLPFIFNVRIAAPFRGLLGTAQSFIDPSALIRNNLGDQYQDKLRQGLAVQPAESDIMPNGERK